MGLIPARAGTTLRCHECRRRSRAHPRSRGDHIGKAPGTASLTGSSPLARGPPRGSSAVTRPQGLIPARAGTTKILSVHSVTRRAHPRSRGDHKAIARVVSDERGSSPLARGPLHSPTKWQRTRGLIPARAGTTTRSDRRPSRSRAHPRSRGDHADMALYNRAYWGSSPLARGPPQTRRRTSSSGGLIPARAGTTWCRSP